MAIVEVGRRFKGLAEPEGETPHQQLSERLVNSWLVQKDVVQSNWRTAQASQMPKGWQMYDGSCYFVPVVRQGHEVPVRPLLGASIRFVDDICFVELYMRENELSVLRKEGGRYLLESYVEPQSPHPYVAAYAAQLAMPAPEAFKEPVYSD